VFLKDASRPGGCHASGLTGESVTLRIFPVPAVKSLNWFAPSQFLSSPSAFRLKLIDNDDSVEELRWQAKGPWAGICQLNKTLHVIISDSVEHKSTARVPSLNLIGTNQLEFNEDTNRKSQSQRERIAVPAIDLT
jgi:hypothetical protein